MPINKGLPVLVVNESVIHDDPAVTALPVVANVVQALSEYQLVVDVAEPLHDTYI